MPQNQIQATLLRLKWKILNQKMNKSDLIKKLFEKRDSLTEDDLEKEKNRIIPFIEQGKNRIWKFLDLSQITPGSDLQVEIPLISLGKFLFDIDSEHANIYNFEEWCFMTNNNTLSFRVSSEEE